MVDDLLKELLTSPLEEPRRRRKRAEKGENPATPAGTTITPDGSGEQGGREEIPRLPLLWALGSAALAAVIVISAYAIASEDPAPATTTTTTTTLAAVADDGSPAGLPEGYVPVGDRLGMRVERILSRSDGVFVTVTTVVVNSLDPSGTTGWQGGLWTLVLEDGRRITSSVESFDPLARGTVSVLFPQEGFVAGDVVAIELNGVAARTTAPFSATSTGPVVLDEAGGITVGLVPDQFGLDAGVALALETFSLDAGEGRLTWSLQTDTAATAFLAPELTVALEDGTEVEVPLHVQSSGFANFHPSIPGPLPATGGEVSFRLPDGSGLPTGEDLSVTIDVSITWLTYDPAVVSLPTVDATITELGA